MEGRYYKFYQSPFDRNFYPAETLDIDQILIGYLESPIYPPQTKNTSLFDTAHTTFATDQSSKDQKKQNPLSTDTIASQERIICQIEVSVNKIISKTRAQQIPDDTLNLSRYFHQQICHYLNQLHKCRVLTNQQWLEAQKYFQQPRTFKSNVLLFKSTKIRHKCLQYIESPIFISKLYASSKMKFQRKIAVIKYVQRLCNCIRLSEGQKNRNSFLGQNQVGKNDLQVYIRLVLYQNNKKQKQL